MKNEKQGKNIINIISLSLKTNSTRNIFTEITYFDIEGIYCNTKQSVFDNLHYTEI